MQTLPKKTPTEKKIVTFDFSSEAAVGSTLSVPVLTVTLASGAGSETDLTRGTPSIQGQQVLVLISDGIDGAQYKLLCQVQASNSEVHEMAAKLPVSVNAV